MYAKTNDTILENSTENYPIKIYKYIIEHRGLSLYFLIVFRQENLEY